MPTAFFFALVRSTRPHLASKPYASPFTSHTHTHRHITTMAPSFDCCVKAHYHKGTPVGSESKIGDLDTYVTGSKSATKAVLMVADVWGWSLNNARVLADRYAEAIGAM
jgi:hypothetical protein